MNRDTEREIEGYKYALDQATIVAVTDLHGRITYVNDRFCAVSQFTREELIGQDHRIVNSNYHSKAFMQTLWQTIVRGEVWKGDLRNRNKQGAFYWVDTTIVPLLDAAGSPAKYLAIHHEITARKHVEDALVEANRRIVEEQDKVLQAEKLSSVGLLAAGVAHEINNPLAGLKGCVSALRDGNVESDRRLEYFAAVEDGLDRIGRIVQGLLAYSMPPQTDDMSATGLNEIVEPCLSLVAGILAKKGVTVALDVPVDIGRVMANRSQLESAFLNVLLNAVQASPNDAVVKVAARRQAARIELSIADSGGGIPEAIRPRVYDPFFTTKPQGEGTGLGLSVTLGIVKKHGGDLTIDSDEGRGTRVVISLPCSSG